MTLKHIDGMHTVYWKTSSPYDHHDNPTRQAVEEAAVILRQSGIVAFPTETVYGLGADARSTEAVEKVFAAKGRPSDNPLIVHIADRSQLDALITEVPPIALTLMDLYWPGPLTIVLPLREDVLSPLVTAGLDTVGIRMPNHPIALALIAAADCPIAAPSANRSGRPSPTLASHVREDLDGRVDGILDGGPAGVGLESTVVRILSDDVIHVLRPGGITIEQLSCVSGASVIASAEAIKEAQTAGSPSEGAPYSHAHVEQSEVPRSPGVKYAHYAPQGELMIVRGSSSQEVTTRIMSLLNNAVDDGKVTGLLIFEEHRSSYRLPETTHIISLGSVTSLTQAAHTLFAALRIFDDLGVNYILSESCEEVGIGEAIMNRLIKAASGRIIDLG
ncbi:L-threonylcarbamoyladenylate synthase [Paenibacillus sp. CMAA1364]